MLSIPNISVAINSALTKVLTLVSWGLFFVSHSVTAQAESPLYTIAQNIGQAGINVQLSSTDASSLLAGRFVLVPLPDGGVKSGEVVAVISDPPLVAHQLTGVTSTKIISLEGGAGRVELHSSGDRISAMTIFDSAKQRYYRALIDGSGDGLLADLDPQEFACVGMPAENAPADAVWINPSFTPSLNEVRELQSDASADNVIYIDYWGGAITNATDGANVWNASYGDPINYDAWTLDNSPSFSGNELYYMWQAWAETAEDYAPFEVNVTTSSAVYNATPVANRSRIIATTFASRNAYGICGSSCGGVAYRPSFGHNYYNIGFTFNNGLGSMGMTHSHESGHQLGLSHDGTSTAGYYEGHGDWGPIMGAPFGQRYVQWSKGSYPDASQTQDDISIIEGRLGSRADLEGGSRSSAVTLSGDGSRAVRTLLPSGAASAPAISGDYDYFKFNVPAAGADVNLTVAPELGVDETQSASGEARAANLTMQGALFKAPFSGNIAVLNPSENFPLRPNTNKLVFSGHLESGEYVFWLKNKSPDYSWSTGFDNWGNGGRYSVRLGVDEYPFASCEALTGSAHNFVILGEGHVVERGELLIGENVGGDSYYRGALGSQSEQYVENLPTSGVPLYVRVWSRINGVWRKNDRVCESYSSGIPELYFPQPNGLLEEHMQVFRWSDSGVAATNYRLSVGSSLGEGQIFDSGDMGMATRRAVAGLPTNGESVYVRLWYSTDSAVSWSFKDAEFQAVSTGEKPRLTLPELGAQLGDGYTVSWESGTAPVDRFRVYAGSTRGASDWTRSTNLAADTRSYEIGGWEDSDSGQPVWLRLLWRNALTGEWQRADYNFTAGF